MTKRFVACGIQFLIFASIVIGGACLMAKGYTDSADTGGFGEIMTIGILALGAVWLSCLIPFLRKYGLLA